MKYCGVLKRMGLALSAAALCSLMLAPGLAGAADVAVPSEKDETVYVYTNADGSVKSSEVSSILKNPDGALKLSDSTNLADVKGEGDVSHSGSGSSLTWDAEGKDVTYTGKTSAEAPVAMRVTYTLDGQPVTADELAGKSGKVTIRYDFENHSTQTAAIRGVFQTIYTPFTCVTALMFDGDDFKNVTVENGKVINDGNDIVVAGFAMPGLKQSLGTMADDADVPDHFTVTADVTNFELKSTMTIVTAGIMSELDAKSLGVGEFDDASALTDAMGQLIDGSDKLTTGLEELASSSKQLEAGASSLLGGAQALEGGLYALASDDALGKLQTGAASLASSIGQISGKVSESKTMLAEAAAALENAGGSAEELAAAQAVLERNKDKISEADYATLSKALADGAKSAQTAGAIGGKLKDADASFEALVAGLNSAEQGASSLESGAAGAIDAANELAAGAQQLVGGAEQLNIAVPQLTQAMQQAADGSKTLTQGMQTFNDEGVAQLVNTLQNDFGGTLDRMNALSDAAKSYTNFGGITEGTTGSVKFVFETDAIKKQ